MIEEILPGAVAAEEAFADLADAALFPEEQAAVARAVAERRNEFATVRRCARAALRQLGMPPAPILPGERRAPQWPPGIVGSMTHCSGYRAAALARERDVVAIGIDAEPHAELPEGVRDLVTVDAERGMLSRLADEDPTTCWDRLLFSAKESIYKAWYPLTGRWLDFADAQVIFEPIAQRFTTRLSVPGVGPAGQWPEFTGRYLVGNGLVLTAVTVLAAPTAA
jgi:4'-phosphopantetheinyl transferase EntD